MNTILIQLDTDLHASTFDSITAIDAGVEQLLSHALVTPSNVTPLVQGGIFTRSPENLKNTAIFVGGSDVEAGEAVFKAVRDCFFGPMRVSVMMDSNGCNTTAAAAVVHIRKHIPLNEVNAVILGGTGPVGRRVASILHSQGAQTTIVSRSKDRAAAVAGQIKGVAHRPQAAELPGSRGYSQLLEGHNVVVAAGAAGVEFLSLEDLQAVDSVRLAIDLNAVPPLGIEGIESTDKGRKAGQLTVSGAVGIGGLKMKIHHALIKELFSSNEKVFGTTEIYDAAVNLG